jgi:hypothetical protein
MRCRNLANWTAYTILLRSCAVGAVLAGVLFVVWGYIDRPHIPLYLDAVEAVLSLIVPALFLVGLTGLSVLCKRWSGVLGWTGLILALCGPTWGVVDGIADVGPLYAFFVKLPLPTRLIGWLLPMLAGLTLVGIATVETRTFKSLGTLPLAMGVFGWIYYLTDSGAILEARSVHVGFGLLFGLGWVALGVALWAVGTRQPMNHMCEANSLEHL